MGGGRVISLVRFSMLIYGSVKPGNFKILCEKECCGCVSLKACVIQAYEGFARFHCCRRYDFFRVFGLTCLVLRGSRVT